MSFFDHTSGFNKPIITRRFPPKAQEPVVGHASTAPSKQTLQRWAERLHDVLGNDLDPDVERTLDDLLRDIEQAAKLAS
jgi:hypothetical protein